MTDRTFNGVKVFSATMVHDRMVLGEKVSEWMLAHPRYEMADIVITQSSDSAFHCIAITVFYRDPDHVARMFPPARRLAFVSKHGDSPEEDVPAPCAHPPHRIGYSGASRKRVCMNCGATVTGRAS